MQVKIERLASKLELSLKGNIEVKPDGATFVFGNWTLDAVNSTFYPFAEKTLLSEVIPVISTRLTRITRMMQVS